MLLEFEFAGSHGQSGLAAGHSRDSLTLAYRVGKVLVELLGQLGLVIPKIDLRRSSVHMEVDDRFCFGWKMGQSFERRMDSA